MQTPTILKDAEVYLGGNRFLSRAKTFSLPGVTTQTETFEALATGGPIEIPLPGVTDDLDGSIQFAGHEKSVYELLDSGQAKLIEVLESQQRMDTQTGEQVEVKHQATLRGLFRDHELPDRERAQADGPTFTYSATYYKYTIDGETVLEIDKLAMVHKVLRNGALVDLQQNTRSNIGIS